MSIKELRAKARESLKGNWLRTSILSMVILIIIALPKLILFHNKLSIGIDPTVHILENILKNVFSVTFLAAILYLLVSLITELQLRVIGVARKEKMNNFLKEAFTTGTRIGFGILWEFVKRNVIWFAIIFACDISLRTGIFLKNFEVIIAFFSLIIVMVNFSNYFFALYLKHDYPEKSIKELFDKSKEMMHGNRAKLFTIPFTILGWSLLSFIGQTIVKIIYLQIWPSVTTMGTPHFTIPFFPQLSQTIIVSFIGSFVWTYLQMIFYYLYEEQNPREVFDEAYVKPVANSAKYIKLLIVLCCVSPIVVLGGLLVLAIFNVAIFGAVIMSLMLLFVY